MSKKKAILNAAKKLFAEKGYEATSPSDIQKLADSGQGSFYHHYSGKTDLGGKAITELANEMKKDIDTIFDDKKKPLSRVWDFLTFPRSGLSGCPLGRLTQEGSIKIDEIRQPVEDYFSYTESKLTKAFSEAKQNGDLHGDTDPTDLASAMLAMVEGSYILAIASNDPTVLDKALRGVVTLLEDVTSK